MSYYDMQLDRPSNSMLKHFRRSPLAYYDHVTGGESEDTDAMRFGRAFHQGLLEPVDFARDHIVLPKGNLSSKSGKCDWYTDALDDMATVDGMVAAADMSAAELRSHVCSELSKAGRTVITEGELEMFHAQIASLNLPCHDPVRRLLSLFDVEVEIRWKELGLEPKAKLDLLSVAHAIGGDVKTTDDADPDEFRRSASVHGYDYQEAMYRRAVEAKYGIRARYDQTVESEYVSDFLFAFILVGKRRPYHWSWCKLDPAKVAAADAVITHNLTDLRKCLDTNEWPGRWTEEPVEVSPWRKVA